MPAARIRRGTLQTRIDVYRHPETGKTVTLVGMVHIAAPEFYASVARLAERLESKGATVHYELSKSPTNDEEMTPEEAALIARMKAARTVGVVAELLGLGTQHSLAIRPGWVNTDLALLEMIRAHRYPETLVSSSEGLIALLDDPQMRPTVARLALFAFRYIGTLAWVRVPFSLLTRKGREAHRVIVMMRNRIAIDAAVAATGDVVALWGSEHLRGIGAGLRQHGFRLTGRTWLDALSKGHRLPDSEAILRHSSVRSSSTSQCSTTRRHRE